MNIFFLKNNNKDRLVYLGKKFGMLKPTMVGLSNWYIKRIIGLRNWYIKRIIEVINIFKLVIKVFF